MALVSITPVAASVAWDARHALPARVRFADRDLRVTRVGAIRDERAAYPAGSSPRLTVVVESIRANRWSWSSTRAGGAGSSTPWTPPPRTPVPNQPPGGRRVPSPADPPGIHMPARTIGCR